MTTRIGPELIAHIEAQWPAFIDDIASGELVKDAQARALFTGQQMRAFCVMFPERKRELDAAREESSYALMEEAFQIARTRSYVATDKDGKPLFDRFGKPLIIAADAAHARNAIDVLKWASRVRNPRVFSDKSQLDVNVRTVDLTAIIQDANARLVASRQVGNAALLPAIDAQATRLLESQADVSD